MAIDLNHTIVHALHPQVSATFLSEILGLAPPRRLYHFWVVSTANGVSLDFLEADPGFDIQHLAAASIFVTPRGTTSRSSRGPTEAEAGARC
jgi:hypothetical protein